VFISDDDVWLLVIDLCRRRALPGAVLVLESWLFGGSATRRPRRARTTFFSSAHGAYYREGFAISPEASVPAADNSAA